MENCEGCSGGCDSCGGCGRDIVLTEGELRMLETLSQIPFLPVARKMDDETPVYLEEGDPEAFALVLQCLEKRGLISLDFDKPLKGGYGQAYCDYPIRGSFALTRRGQQVIELLDVQGVE